MHVPPALQIALVVFSVATFLATLIGIPLFLVRVKDDYFAHEPQRSAISSVLRTLLGVVLVALGLVMLVLPGQGMLTVLVGLGVMDLPFKRRLVRRILTTPKIERVLTKMRRRHGRGPLLPPLGDEPVPAHV